jgi:PAS domain-containing protein
LLSTSIIRGANQQPYSRSEVAAINALSTQLRAVGNLALRIGISSAQRLANSFAAAGEPIALIRHDGCVLHLSPSFEKLIGCDSITIRDRRLGSWSPEVNRKLVAAIDRVVRYDGQLQKTDETVALPRRKGRRPLIASIAPVVGAAHDILHLVAAIISLTDLESEPLGPSMRMMQDSSG